MDKNKFVKYPSFELAGSKCPNVDCDGVLCDYFNLKTKIHYQECSKCKQKFNFHTLEKNQNNIKYIEDLEKYFKLYIFW